MLRAFVFSFLAIIYSMSVYSKQLNCEDCDLDNEFLKKKCLIMQMIDDSSQLKAVTIMDMMDRNKSKTKDKVLSVLLEVELKVLEGRINDRIKGEEDSLIRVKEHLPTLKNQIDIQSCLDEIEWREKWIQHYKKGFKILAQWKEEYCL